MKNILRCIRTYFTLLWVRQMCEHITSSLARTLEPHSEQVLCLFVTASWVRRPVPSATTCSTVLDLDLQYWWRKPGPKWLRIITPFIITGTTLFSHLPNLNTWRLKVNSSGVSLPCLHEWRCRGADGRVICLSGCCTRRCRGRPRVRWDGWMEDGRIRDGWWPPGYDNALAYTQPAIANNSWLCCCITNDRIFDTENSWWIEVYLWAQISFC